MRQTTPTTTTLADLLQRRGVVAALIVANAALGAVMLYILGMRELNFDEALALRSGWLVVNDVPARPAFLMPFTAWLGSLASLWSDPLHVVIAARLSALALLLIAGVVFWRCMFWSTGVKLLWLLALFGSAIFVLHGLAFRYDTAILAGWVALFALLHSPRSFAWLGAGIALAWIQFHHLKGAFFAGASLTLVGLQAWHHPHTWRLLRRFVWGWLGATLLWLGGCALFGKAHIVLAMYTQFFAASQVPAHFKTWPTVLASDFERDIGFWSVMALAFLLVAKNHRNTLGPSHGTAFLVLAINAVFWFLHPRPWPYMLAMTIPFAAAIAVTSLAALPWRTALLVLAFGVTAQSLGEASNWYQDMRRSLQHTHAPLIQTLRFLRQHMKPTDRIIDPSGSAYFVKPSQRDWYIDFLFRTRASGQGTWMKALTPSRIAQTPWLLSSHRLSFLPPRIQHELHAHFVPLAFGLLFHRHDRARLQRLRRQYPHTPTFSVASFW